MTNEERDLITRFIQRVVPATTAGGFGGSVPATTTGAPPPAPIDRDADALIADLFNRSPEARYRITQLAFMQEHALAEAANLINRLQWELQQAKQAQAQAQAPAASPWGAAAQPQQPPQQSRGFLGGLFGGGQQQAAPPPPPPQYAPPPPQYAPGYQPGMFQRQGSGFLGSALSTAAGVAGGVVAADALMNLFSGNHGGGGGGFGGGGFGGGAPGGFIPEAAASPWGSPAASPGVDPYDVGGAQKDSSDTGWTTPGGQQPDTDTGWQDTSSNTPTDSGWQDASAAPDTDDSGWTDTSNNNNC